MLPKEDVLNLDKSIILEIMNCANCKLEFKTWAVCQKINWGDIRTFENKRDRTNFYISKNMVLQRRLDVLRKEGLISVEIAPGGEKTIKMYQDKVSIEKHKLNGKIKSFINVKMDSGKSVLIEI